MFCLKLLRFVIFIGNIEKNENAFGEHFSFFDDEKNTKRNEIGSI